MGMDIQKVPFFDIALANAPHRDEILAATARVLDEGSLMDGAEAAAFEREFTAYVGVADCVSASSGTDALRLVLTALGAARRDAVVSVPNASIATAEAILQAGPKLCFVDVDPLTGLIDPGRLEDFLRDDANPRPKFVLAAHHGGQCADMDALNALGGRYEFMVIEDARQAHGAMRLERRGLGTGRKAGSMGQAAVFSFSPEKNLGALGQGGAVTTSDAQLAQSLRSLRSQGLGAGVKGKLDMGDLQMDALQAAVLRMKLPRLDAANERRRAVAAIYDRGFEGTGYTEPLSVAPLNVPNRHIYALVIPDREDMRAYLADKGVCTGVYHPLPLHLLQRLRRLGFKRGDFPNAEMLAQKTLSLPIRPDLSHETAGWIVETVRAFGGSMQ